MMRLSSLALLLAALAGLVVQAQTQKRSPAPQLNNRQPVTFTIDSAPEALVYRLFFAELTAAQRKGDKLAAQGKNAAPLRNEFRRISALISSDFDTLQRLAGEAVAAQETASRQAASLVKSAATDEDRRRVAPEVIRLRTEAEATEHNSIDSLRAFLGLQKFAQLARMFHTESGLARGPGQNSAVTTRWARSLLGAPGETSISIGRRLGGLILERRALVGSEWRRS